MDNDLKDWLGAHETMACVLDAKFAEVPEWRAFRAIDRVVLEALRKSSSPTPTPSRSSAASRLRVYIAGDPQQPLPYMTLAANALAERGAPLSTVAIFDYITAHRQVGPDPKKARIVIQSSLSKDERFQSIAWHDGRAWWFADKPVPKIEAAGTKPAA